MAHVKHKHVPSVDVKHMDHHLVMVEGRNRQVCKQAFTPMTSLSKIYYINHGSLQKYTKNICCYSCKQGDDIQDMYWLPIGYWQWIDCLGECVDQVQVMVDASHGTVRFKSL